MRRALPGPETSDYAALIRPTDCLRTAYGLSPADCDRRGGRHNGGEWPSRTIDVIPAGAIAENIMKKIICLIVVVFLLTACAANYERSSGTVGYQEVRLDSNVFRVTFTGNDFTDPRKVSDFALLRSAELALEYGYRYFAIVDAVESVGYGTQELWGLVSNKRFEYHCLLQRKTKRVFV